MLKNFLNTLKVLEQIHRFKPAYINKLIFFLNHQLPSSLIFLQADFVKIFWVYIISLKYLFELIFRISLNFVFTSDNKSTR